ncbi:peptidoglycan-binding protein [Mesorhizobium sp. CGMCC 1.15528]|uniref:Peptidoglycan-binding protein n=1 Tax=Mesorhizobium zhangyense TaxID=1776730 RepID=A0A7C9R4R8_9HYPH|nr:peptidoglycan-binding protein [Mesorhizobium zhangyense]NGN40157.1 peptidoglycan-binding protein [Mesorhizobium zhangyense]
MNSKRSYLDTLNTGRLRKPHTTLEELNRSLENLEQRLSRPQDAGPDFSRERDDMRRQQRFADLPYGQNRVEDNRYAAPQPAPRASAYDQPYQTIARDLDRVRAQEDGVAAFGKIAAELQALREDLRQQVTSGMRREFEAVREDIRRAYASGAAKGGVDELGVEFERLSSAIHSLSERSDDKSINMLRLELEQVKGSLDLLAREETVRSVDRRWDDFNKRWTDFEDRISTGSHDPAISALTSRLEQINDAVNNLPESLSLRSLEEKVRTLAGAVDHFARQQENTDANTFGQIEVRLDEISRAIVASTAAATLPNFDPAPFERIEARISALARQIEEVAGDQPTGNEVMERLGLLSSRVDQITQQIHLPEAAVERLGKQIAIIADKIDRAPASPDADYIFQGIEQRFDHLSDMIERRQGDAAEQSNTLFRDLERRLDEVADRLDQRAHAPALDNSGIMDAIDARFATLAERLEARQPEPADNAAIRKLEARLESISSRLDSSASQFANIDPDLIRNLEAQVSGLSQHLARPSSPLPEFEDIGPRLNDIEKSIAGSHDSILEAARQAAESAVRSLSGSQTHTVAVTGLADDLKALEALTRRSDERNTETFEAIHDTLLKIVDRLGSLEQDERPASKVEPEPLNTLRKMALQDTPSLDFDDGLPLVEGEDRPSPSRVASSLTPAQAAAAAASAALDSDTIADDEPEAGPRSMFGGLGRVFKGRKGQAAKAAIPEPVDAVAKDEAPSVDLDEPLDPKFANRPLEPGSGAPDLNAIMRRVRDERGQPAKAVETEAAKADFIAAARRAAQAAAAEAEALKRDSSLKGPVKALRIGDLLKARRKPILMAAAAIMMALAGLQLGKAFMAGDAEVAEVVTPAIEQPAEQPAQTAMAEVPQAPAPVQMDSLADARSEAPAARTVDLPQDSLAADPETTPEEATAAITEPAPAPETTASTSPIEQSVDNPAGVINTPAEPMLANPVMASASPAATPAATEQSTTAAVSVPTEAGPVALREAAGSGDAKALFEIGSRYADGRGVKADMKTAAKWYEQSAEAGFAPAQYRIGNFYEKGLGVERDVDKAKTWYQLAASQGNASAMHNLAVLFAMGADGTADNESAARWFIQAAELGVKDSQFNLGILAAKGVGMPQNLEESYKWFALVAKTGDKDATAKRDEIGHALRPEQLERARAATELWKAKPLDTASNSVDIPEAWQESQGTTASVDLKKAVRNIQAILNKNGYDAGGADGVMGLKTKNAIAAFQKANGMDANGEIDEKVVRALLALNK